MCIDSVEWQCTHVSITHSYACMHAQVFEQPAAAALTAIMGGPPSSPPVIIALERVEIYHF